MCIAIILTLTLKQRVNEELSKKFKQFFVVLCIPDYFFHPSQTHVSPAHGPWILFQEQPGSEVLRSSGVNDRPWWGYGGVRSLVGICWLVVVHRFVGVRRLVGVVWSVGVGIRY